MCVCVNRGRESGDKARALAAQKRGQKAIILIFEVYKGVCESVCVCVWIGEGRVGTKLEP